MDKVRLDLSLVKIFSSKAAVEEDQLDITVDLFEQVGTVGKKLHHSKCQVFIDFFFRWHNCTLYWAKPPQPV